MNPFKSVAEPGAGVQEPGDRSSDISNTKPPGESGHVTDNESPASDVRSDGAFTTSIALAVPTRPSPSSARNTRLETVCEIEIAPDQTPLTKLSDTGGFTGTPFVELSKTVPLKFVNTAFVTSIACTVTANALFTNRGEGIGLHAK